MNVYLIVPRNEGFLGALRAVRAASDGAARLALREGGQCSFDYDLIQLSAGSKAADGRLAGPEFSEGESGAGPATDSARSETCCGAAPTVEREGQGREPATIAEMGRGYAGCCTSAEVWRACERFHGIGAHLVCANCSTPIAADQGFSATPNPGIVCSRVCYEVLRATTLRVSTGATP